jgi:hypothetical protein
MRTTRSLAALATLAIALVACGGASSGAAAPELAGDAGRGIGSTGSEPGAAAATAAPAPAEGQDAANAIGIRDDARIVRTGTVDLEVRDVPQALRAARDAIVALGGYVGASNTSNVADRPTAQITYRVPADRWEDALDALRDLNGQTTKVVDEHTDAVEVTGQVIDLQARIRNLRASETALQGIAAKATKIADVLEVEARLTDVRGQIEQLTAQLEDLTDRASYSTLTASFSTPVVAVEAASKDWEPATTVDEATASLISILQALATAGIWFLIVWLPLLLVLGLVGGAGVWLARRAGIGRGGGRGLPPPPTLPGEPVATEG